MDAGSTPSISPHRTNQFETLWIKTTIMCCSPQFCGLTRQFRYWSHLDSLPGLQSGDSPIIRGRTVVLPRRQQWSKRAKAEPQDLWSPGSETKLDITSTTFIIQRQSRDQYNYF